MTSPDADTPADAPAEPDGLGPDEPSPDATLYTLGVGDLLADRLLERLQWLDVELVVDLRAPPFDIDRLDVAPGALAAALAPFQVEHLDLGAQLGAHRNTVGVRTQGRLDYRKLYRVEHVREALSRVAAALADGRRVCALGRDPAPELCARARLLGRVLARRGFSVRHLNRFNALVTQRDVEDAIALSGDDPDLEATPT
jgi:hypothetical protein